MTFWPGENYQQQLANIRAENAQKLAVLSSQQGASNGNRQTNPQTHSGSIVISGGSGNSGAVIPISCVASAASGWVTFCTSGITVSAAGTATFSIEAGPVEPIEGAGIIVGEIIGWRMWGYYKGYLRSYSQERVWAPGENMIGIPSDHGSDGIWAFKEKSRALAKMLNGGYRSEETVYGSVKIWGKVIEHELGYRAEYAKIISLEDAYMTGDKQKVLRELRCTYGVAA